MVSDRCHLVRVGALGQIGRFAASDAARYPRGSRVIVRTGRGLEIGEVLAEPDESARTADGALVRRLTVEDELLASRLEKNRHLAFAACAARLGERLGAATLLEVEHLFDGRTLVFYFLGTVSDEDQLLVSQLAEEYEAEAQTSHFAALLAEGCGPGCGTEAAEGHGCTNCASGCAVAEVCGSKRLDR